MSFILDALRKSETERQRKSGPGLIDAGHRPPAARRAVWIPLLVIVLAANLAALAFIFLRQPAGAPQARATAAPQEPAAPAPVDSAGTSAAGEDLRPGNDEEAAYAATAAMPAIDAGGSGATTTAEPPPGAPGQHATPGVIEDGLPSAAELIASGALNLPALHLDMHVFTPDPAGRFVFINMRKYTEGARLSEGPQLEEITRDGAVLSYNGRQFVLNRN